MTSSDTSVCAAAPLGVIIVPGDVDLETCRLLVERLQDELDQVGKGFVYSLTLA